MDLAADYSEDQEVDQPAAFDFVNMGVEMNEEIAGPDDDLAWHSDSAISKYTDSEADDTSAQATLKRPANEELMSRAFKRQKGVFNADFLDLLNSDIEDAAHRVCLADEDDLESSQLGVTFWSASEKKLFFEAVARLGRHDLPKIASRIGTKSEIEVHHYLEFLAKTQWMRQKAALRPVIEFSEYPAAVELSQQCCHALDEAADAVSVRQERKEEQREEGKWGECWDITPRIARRLDRSESVAPNKELASAGLFHLHTWLRLSERIFMNSAIPSENWHFLDDHAPSVWATTFEDFYSLAVSITRRLVQTTIFLSMSRIKAKKSFLPATRGIVRQQDVEAAVASLAMRLNADEFWTKCARRLRLQVYDEPPDREEEADQEPMTYDEIEQLLSGEEAVETEQHTLDPKFNLESSSSEEDDADGDETDSEARAPKSLSDEEEEFIKHEANEVLRFSAADFPETYRTKQSLNTRIATERRQEQYSEECDQYASRQAEAQMWELLQKRAPTELPKMQEPGPVPRSKLDVESIFPIGRDWKSKTKYMNEWEADPVPVGVEDDTE